MSTAAIRGAAQQVESHLLEASQPSLLGRMEHLIMIRWAFFKMLSALSILCALYATSYAQSAGPKLGQPIYDPQAKRYFEMVNPSGTLAGGGVPWQSAFTDAKRRVYKGVRGRLAVIDSPQVMEFLATNFHPDSYAWIGLIFWCDTRKLQWVDGRFMKPGGFQAWDPHWKADVYICKSDLENVKREFAPVAFTKEDTWVMKGLHKWYIYYFVEYPTGSP